MGDCTDCKYKDNMGKWPCNDCVKGDKWEEEPMTNADRIRSMTDEEMAEWLMEHVDCGEGCPTHSFCNRCMEDMECEDWLLQWLKQEVKE